MSTDNGADVDAKKVGAQCLLCPAPRHLPGSEVGCSWRGHGWRAGAFLLPVTSAWQGTAGQAPCPGHAPPQERPTHTQTRRRSCGCPYKAEPGVPLGYMLFLVDVGEHFYICTEL